MIKNLGKIYNCEIYHGEHVNNFHNYEIMVSLSKKLGGGIVLTQIHELDYQLFLVIINLKIINILVKRFQI